MLGEEGENKREIEFFVWKTERNYDKIFLYVCTQIRDFFMNKCETMIDKTEHMF